MQMVRQIYLVFCGLFLSSIFFMTGGTKNVSAEVYASTTHDCEKLSPEKNLLPMSSRGAQSVQPSTFETVQNESQLEKQDVRFQFLNSFDNIQIHFSPQALTENAFPIHVMVNGQTLKSPPLWVGFRPLVQGKKGGKAVSDAKISVENCISEKQQNGCCWHCELRVESWDQTVPITIEAKSSGKSIRLQIDAPAGYLHGTTLRWKEGLPVPSTYEIWPTFYYHTEKLYGSAFPDMWHSDFRHGAFNGSSYAPLSDGTYRPLRDVYYITFSSRYEETISNVPHKPSPYLEEFASRVLLDLWGKPFAEDQQTLEMLSQYGIDRLLVIKHTWQRDGYDQSYPNVFPANAKQGGDAGLRKLAQAAKLMGHRFCVHENLYDFYPNAEDFCEADCALNSDGSKQEGWDQGRVTAKVLKTTKLMEYAKRFSPEIGNRYGCDSAYHDIMPSWLVDQDADATGSGMIRFTHETTKKLCDYDRQLFHGPILCEAADNQMAGVYDGGTAALTKIENMPLLPITELLKVHPKMANQGMSYYERWLEWGYAPGWYWYLMPNRKRDKYRAMTVAFGRMGFLSQQLANSTHGMIREYHLMQAFGHAYTGQPVVRLRYHADDQWIDAGTAALTGKWHRLHVTYEGGQEVYVNVSKSPWNIEGVTLPQYGYLTKGPRSTAWTALVDGQIADYARYGDMTYVDARSHVWAPDPAIQVEVQNFKDLDNGTFELSLAWKIPNKLSEDYRIFQHYRKNDTTCFQKDYFPPKQTSKWPVGKTTIDGPLRITIPQKHSQTNQSTRAGHDYKLFVGLSGKKERFAFAREIHELNLGTLHVSADTHAITFNPTENGLSYYTASELYFAETNRDRRILHFPCDGFAGIATNGAVVIKHEDKKLRIIPVPLNEMMTIAIPGISVKIQAEDNTEVSTYTRNGWTWFETDQKSKFYHVNVHP